MSASSINAGTFLVNSAGGAVAGTVAYNAATNTATFTPAGALSFGAAYTVTITTAIVDQAQNGLVSNFVFSFVTNFPPAAPQLISPAGGATGVTRPVVLRWSPSSDQDADAVSYRLFICNDPSFIGSGDNCRLNVPVTLAAARANKILIASMGGLVSLIVLLGVVLGGGIRGGGRILLFLAIVVMSGVFIYSCGSGSGGASEITFQVDGLAANVTYFWKVEADDGKGGVTASDVKSFTTQ
jgi:hypothetical protein